MGEVSNIISGKGVSADYILAFGTLDNCVRRVNKEESARWKILSRNAFHRAPILKYEEYFNSSEYENVVNDENREIVKQLDEIVAELNAMREANDTDHEKLSALWDKINKLMFDESRKTD